MVDTRRWPCMRFNLIPSSSSFTWKKNTNLTSQGCDKNGKFAFVTHGITGAKGICWIPELIRKLLQYRGGCVIYLNWKKYSDPLMLPFIYYKWEKVSDVLAKKLFQLESEGVSPDNMYLYGHSFGARISIQAGLTFGKNKIAQIDGK